MVNTINKQLITLLTILIVSSQIGNISVFLKGQLFVYVFFLSFLSGFLKTCQQMENILSSLSCISYLLVFKQLFSFGLS